MQALLLLALLSFQDEQRVIHLVEEIETRMPGVPTSTDQRNIYIGSIAIRTDWPTEDLRFLYDLRVGTLIIVDLNKKTYYLSRPGRDKSMARTPFTALVDIEDGMLMSRGPLVRPTGRKGLISGSECTEYVLNFRARFGVSTSIWSTDSRQSSDKRDFKKIWQAANGTLQPLDVKQVINRLFSEIKGVPVRIQTAINQEGITIVNTSTIVHIDRDFKASEGFFKIPPNFEIMQDKIDLHTWRP